MKKLLYAFFAVILMSLFLFCNNNNKSEKMSRENKAVFLHHSTGRVIWKGDASRILFKLFKTGSTQKWIEKFNETNNTEYSVNEVAFPKTEPYGWNNYPYDYYNIWVKNAGNQPYMSEPTLEILTKQCGLIIWKHCFPVSEIEADTVADIESNIRSLANYKLQYNALKKKMHEFPDTKFLVWTGAVHVKSVVKEEQAVRMKEFVNWVKNEWDEKGDNIFLWDFYELETEGGLFLKDQFARSTNDSHPNEAFAARTSKLFAQRIFDVMQGKGDEKLLIGN